MIPRAFPQESPNFQNEKGNMKPHSNLEGIIVPLVTPFDEYGELASSMASPLITRLRKAGVNGFYVGGGTGEGMLQSVDERREYLQYVAEVSDGNCALIAQVGAMSFRLAAELADAASDFGYHAISSTPPFYFNYSDNEIVSYYKELAEHSALPLLLYNIPSSTGTNLSIEVQCELLSLPNVIGTKHTDTNLYAAERLCRSVDNTIVFAGADEMLLAGLAMGADGGIGSTYNLMPRHFVEIYRCVKEGDLEKARATQSMVNDIIFELHKISPSIIPGIKLGLRILGYDVGRPRKPFQEIDANTQRFQDLVQAYGRCEQ